MKIENTLLILISNFNEIIQFTFNCLSTTENVVQGLVLDLGLGLGFKV
jgi:hypothetical protein